MQKISSLHHFILEIKSVLESRDQIGHIHFWPCTTKHFLINFQFIRTCFNMQKMRISSICSGEMVDLKILQSELLRAFWPISQEKNLSQIEDLCRNTENNINFHYRTNSGKIYDQIFLWIQKPLFWPIFGSFPLLWGLKKVIPKNLVLSRTAWQGFLVQCRNSEKPNDLIRENTLTDSRMEGRADPTS